TPQGRCEPKVDCRTRCSGRRAASRMRRAQSERAWLAADSRRSPASALEIPGVESRPEGGHSMSREFSVIIERDAEGYYVASVPALRGCHTQATSLDELMVRVREAVELCLEVQGEGVEPLDFIGVQKITVA